MEEFRRVLSSLVKSVEPVTPMSEIQKIFPILKEILHRMDFSMKQIADTQTMLASMDEVDIDQDDEVR